MTFDAVLLIAFGGPTAPADVRPFLDNVTRGRDVTPERLELVVKQYERIGGRSPLNDLTLAQARALERALAAAGHPIRVHVGMRNWRPYLHETLAALAADGVRRVRGIILSPLRSEASWDRYVGDVREARARVPDAPEVEIAPAWSAHPRYLDAVADRAAAALAEIAEPERTRTPLVFTAHSIPVAMADASPYLSDLSDAARAVTERLGHPGFSVAYQSRSGSPRDPWLEPDINAVVRRLAETGDKRAVVVPLGFVVDHVEVLYDLDVQARETAVAVGVELHRAATVNDHPGFIAALADTVVNA